MMCIKHGLNILKMRVSTLLVFSVEPELSPGVSFSKAGGGWGGEADEVCGQAVLSSFTDQETKDLLGGVSYTWLSAIIKASSTFFLTLIFANTSF